VNHTGTRSEKRPADQDVAYPWTDEDSLDPRRLVLEWGHSARMPIHLRQIPRFSRHTQPRISFWPGSA
jgi:hypothetical protein